MLRPFLLSLVPLVLVGGGLGAAEPTADVSTWRWSVNAILEAQRASPTNAGDVRAETCDQRYRHQRYSPAGLPEVSTEAGSR